MTRHDVEPGQLGLGVLVRIDLTAGQAQQCLDEQVRLICLQRQLPHWLMFSRQDGMQLFHAVARNNFIWEMLLRALTKDNDLVDELMWP